jgi:peroxidase
MNDPLDTTMLMNEFASRLTPSLDGSSDNLEHPSNGMACTEFSRKTAPAYADGINSMAIRTSGDLPNPRNVSNCILYTTKPFTPSTRRITNMGWLWGQFLDHELALTEHANSESLNVIAPTDSKEQYPGAVIPLSRNKRYKSWENVTPRTQKNLVSSHIDATNIYSVSSTRLMTMRRLDGTGKLQTSNGPDGALAPYNLTHLENGAPPGSKPEDFFLFGDIRGNENVSLTAIHTLFIREHNRLCDSFVANDITLTGKEEVLFQKARAIITGQVNKITYEEFLPALGIFIEDLPYSADIDSSITTEFATVGYRFGHFMVPSEIPDGLNTFQPLRDMYFNTAFVARNGIDNLLLGAATSFSRDIDGTMTEALRSFVLMYPSPTLLHDLGVWNMQRGREHGLPGYNDVREAYGLSRHASFSTITSNTSVALELQGLYVSPDNMDPWIGGAVENHAHGCPFGDLFKNIISEQFTRLWQSDRMSYRTDTLMNENDRAVIRSCTLSSIIARNTAARPQPNAFIL